MNRKLKRRRIRKKRNTERLHRLLKAGREMNVDRPSKPMSCSFRIRGGETLDFDFSGILIDHKNGVPSEEGVALTKFTYNQKPISDC